MIRSGKVFIAGRSIWLAWYPLRGLRCNVFLERNRTGRHLGVGLGPIYLGLGSGVPTP